MDVNKIIKMFAGEVLNPALLKLRRGKIYRWNPTWHGINLGCGFALTTNWVGIDGGIFFFYRKLPSLARRLIFPALTMSAVYSYDECNQRLKSLNVLYHDLKYGIPYNTAVVSNIYSSYLFCQLSYNDAHKLIRECHRVLQRGGMIRLAVPSLEDEIKNMRTALDQYEKGNRQPIMRYLIYNPDSAVSNYKNSFSIEKYKYDFNDLKQLMLDAGFVDIVKCDYRSGKIIDVDKLDTKKDSLFVEALKT